jgi:hypothetical protein
MIYTQLFANSCNNNSVKSSVNSNGEVNWSTEIFQNDDMMEDIGFTLTANNIVFIVSVNSIRAFDNKGNFKWKREIYPKTPVVIRENKLFFTSDERKTRMQAIDFENKIVLDDFLIPEITQSSFLVLFEPIENGLIAQVQYQPLPDEGEKSFIIYRIHTEGMDMEWEKNYYDETSKVIPIVSIDRSKLVTSTRSKALVFNTKNTVNEVEPISEFELPLKENTMWLSANDNFDLFWLGSEGGATKLISTDTQGNENWFWQSKKFFFENESVPITPPVISNNLTFVLTQKNLFAIKGSKSEWEFNAEDGNFSFATALDNDTILLVKGNQLYYLNSQGEVVFNRKFEDDILAAPVVDEDGIIYLVTNKMLFAIH